MIMYVFFDIDPAQTWVFFQHTIVTTFGTVSQMYLIAYKYSRPTQLLILA